MLNPRAEVRLSKCPKCQKRTHLCKFALFIHVDGWGPMALGKTCRYCSACELIMAHQDELEAELGTIDKKVWRAGLEGRDRDFAEILEHVADFEKEYDLVYEPGRWYPADEGSRK
jgi:MinD superfamily P-loop ATPase